MELINFSELFLLLLLFAVFMMISFVPLHFVVQLLNQIFLAVEVD